MNDKPLCFVLNPKSVGYRGSRQARKASRAFVRSVSRQLSQELVTRVDDYAAVVSMMLSVRGEGLKFNEVPISADWFLCWRAASGEQYLPDERLEHLQAAQKLPPLPVCSLLIRMTEERFRYELSAWAFEIFLPLSQRLQQQLDLPVEWYHAAEALSFVLPPGRHELSRKRWEDDPQLVKDVTWTLRRIVKVKGHLPDPPDVVNAAGEKIAEDSDDQASKTQ